MASKGWFRTKKKVEDPNKGEPVETNKRLFRLSDFELKETLGRGTFSRVRLARHAMDEQHYAIKILKKIDILRLEQLQHTKDEVGILERVQHPFVVKLHGYFMDECRVFMVLDFVCGGEIFTRLRAAPMGRFEDEEAKFYISEIVLALNHMHQMNVMYRDIKPENLLINRLGHVVLTDFGFAKVLADRTFTLCGTPEYLAPEMIQGVGHGKSVDWWALGILLFEMIAGYPPFYDTNPFGIYQKVLDGLHSHSFTNVFTYKAKDLCKRLLIADRTKRLGCMKAAGEGVKGHKWFTNTNWDELYHTNAQPPHIPTMAGDDDTSCYDTCKLDEAWRCPAMRLPLTQPPTCNAAAAGDAPLRSCAPRSRLGRGPRRPTRRSRRRVVFCFRCEVVHRKNH
mmetsp:Transcript_46498/g.129587  ORF Transcript_46498/g.129587 Transcript_46498/m.129587 type:complete len:395 (-) Transcript_46498:138-1322(-)